jgi:hypothetical protein
MDATRRRFGSVVEWLVAAACASGGVVLVSIGVQEFRGVRPVIPVSANEAMPAPSLPGIPSGVVSVPLLLLGDDRAIRVGERLSVVEEHLGATAQRLSESVAEAGDTQRTTRFYDAAAVRFILVFERNSRERDARLSAIFIR